MSKKTFILSDQTRNQYGFVVLTAGIDLDRFLKNPVMLEDHALGLRNVIGKWDTTRKEGVSLLADSNFDLEDENAKLIAGKVERDFIKGTSVWIDFKEEDVKLDVAGYIGIPVVTKSELMEASIVSVPNNKNSIKLTASGKQLEDDSLALKLSAATQNQNQENNMKELALIFAALGLKFTATSTEQHAVEAIEALKKESESFKTKLDAAEVKLSAENDAKVTALIDNAITSKKLTADKKDHFTKLAKQDFETTKAILDGMTAHVTLSSQLGADGKEKGEAKNQFEGKGFKELMKSKEGANYLTKLKADKDPLHKQLWEADFPGGKYNA